VTGATALLPAEQGAPVVGVCRNLAKNEYSSRFIKVNTRNPHVKYILADLYSQKDFCALDLQLLSEYNRRDVMINIAGATDTMRQDDYDDIPINQDYSQSKEAGIIRMDHAKPFLRITQQPPVELLSRNKLSDKLWDCIG
jgi:hypothetical protein